MFPHVTYEWVRQRNEERVERALFKDRIRRAGLEGDACLPPPSRDADVIEVMFGARCEVEDAIA